MIAVTGAAGKTGRAVVRALAARGEAVRAIVRRPEQCQRLEALGAEESVVADLTVSADVARSLEGARALYLMAPNMHAEESRIGATAIEAAMSAGVGQVVYHSVLHPQTREMPHHWVKLAVEEALFASGLRFTILQPAAYMQNVLGYWDVITTEGSYPVPYGESAALSVVDLDDVAQVATKVLTDPGHRDAVYELAGPEALTPSRIAVELSAALGIPVAAVEVPVSEWAAAARAHGLDDHSIDALSRMFRYYHRHGLRGSPRVLEWLLGRRPTSFAEFLSRIRSRPPDRT